MSKLLRDDWRDRKATSTPGDVEAEEWLEAVKGDDEAWLDPDFGLPPLHPSELDPLPDVNAPLVATWLDEHLAELVTVQQAELDGPHAAVWRQFGAMLGEIARLRDRLREPHEHAAERELRDWIRDAEQALAAFMRSSTFQTAVCHRLSLLAPVWERIDAWQCDDPESGIIKVRARQQRHDLESLLVSADTAPAAQASAVLLAESAIPEEQADAASLPTKTADAELILAAAPTTKADGGVKRRRTDNLKRAIFAAWEDGLPVESSASETFEYLARKDQSGYIRTRDGDDLIWENTLGGTTSTPLEKLADRLRKYRGERKLGR